MQIEKIAQQQKKFFCTGKTHAMSFRMQALRKLHQAILAHRTEITQALYADLGKNAAESFLCEIGLCLSEISYFLRHMRSFAKPQKVATPLFLFPAKSRIYHKPYGTVLIISPWNYPFLLCMQPLIDALAAGNTAVIKTSEWAPHTAAVVQKIIQKCFPSEYVCVVTGDHKTSTTLLQQKWDYIFFTGSTRIGKIVMQSAAQHITPVTLELGGKSPCVVDETVNIELAARRIVFGKFLNCGQTCVAPDYILCHRSQKDNLIKALQQEIEKQYGKAPLQNPNYGKIIHAQHFKRLAQMLDHSKIVYGGQTDEKQCRIAPTIMEHVTWKDAVMQEEIFGPILPILTYQTLPEVIHTIQSHPAPLALYVFSTRKQHIQQILRQCAFGGGCVNDTIMHIANHRLGFGGIGESGMGTYHGKAGFEQFSQKQSILYNKMFPDFPLRYPPYSPITEKLLTLIFS